MVLTPLGQVIGQPPLLHWFGSATVVHAGQQNSNEKAERSSLQVRRPL